ncbi:MAG: DNA repair protein RecN [Desulfomonilia bacterium]
MIEFLKISSMAIFDEIEIEFTKGLNCITGETGAGKSLILDALTLLLGARSSRELIRPDHEKTTIEALFTVGEKELVLRRELYPSGANRCYIDGKLATVANLSEISSGMIHIYGQHEYQDLLSPRQHTRILDELAGLTRDGVEQAYDSYMRAHESLCELESQIELLNRQRQELEYSLQELDAVSLEEGLEEKFTGDLRVAQASADLMNDAGLVQELLYTGSPSMFDIASEVKRCITRIIAHDREMEPLMRSLETIIAQIEDVNNTLRERSGAYGNDPEAIEALQDQLHSLQDLKHKYSRNEEALIEFREEIRQRLSLLAHSETATDEFRQKVLDSLEDYRSTIRSFLEKREQFSKEFCRHVSRDLRELGMPGARFTVEQLNPESVDAALHDDMGAVISPSQLLRGEFFLSSNVGHALLPLSKIASGGELSRVMLAIKAHQNTSTDATLIFDEIDAGISGQTAITIAQRLKDISRRAQAVVVTHLHQVASLADSHFVITKDVAEKKTFSRLRRVTDMDRVMELARMMGGQTPSSTVIEHAKELVRTNPVEH